MLDGNDLLEAGYPEGPVVGRALAVAHSRPQTLSDDDVMRFLAAVREDPDLYTDHRDASVAKLARAWQRHRTHRKNRQPPSIRETPRSYASYGPELIDANARRQMDEAMQLPVAVAGALMPDAHLGYGLPVGGVLACDDAVIPYAVGVDIACRVMMSIFPAGERYLSERPDAVKEALRRETKFGAGPGFQKGERRQHAVLDDPQWNATPILRGLRDTAYAQLGTSGGGNHFIDAGLLEVGEEAGLEGMEAGVYLAVLSHSGSRGPGYQIADHYSALAEESRPQLPASHRSLAWLGLDTELGQEYWEAMTLAGRFASANHQVIHERVAQRLGLEPVFQVENHHNFAFRETHVVAGEERELIVHRKGATPAGKDVLGIIPGSMGDVSYLVRGRGAPESLDSAAHGAGRKMSRTQAKKTISRAERAAYLRERNVELLGGGLDEAPQAYKPIDEVMAAQRTLASPVARFHPRFVLMAND